MNMQSLFPVFEHLQLHYARQSVSHQVHLWIDSKLVSLIHRSSYYMSSYRATSMYLCFCSFIGILINQKRKKKSCMLLICQFSRCLYDLDLSCSWYMKEWKEPCG